MDKKIRTRVSMDSLKEEGNKSFKLGDYTNAIRLYTQALSSSLKSAHATDHTITQSQCALYCNRAACHLKQLEYKSCLSDCNDALQIQPGNVKALYRGAQAYVGLLDYKNANHNLNKLIHIDKNNADALALMRIVKAFLASEDTASSDIGNLIKLLKQDNDKDKQMYHLKCILGLLCDDQAHAVDFAKRGGISIISGYLQLSSDDGCNSNSDATLLVLRIVASVVVHKPIVTNFVSFDCSSSHTTIASSDNKINIGYVLSVMIDSATYSLSSAIIRALLFIVMNIVKNVPTYTADSASNECIATIPASVNHNIAKCLIATLRYCNKDSATGCSSSSIDMEIFLLVTDSLSAYMSELLDYFSIDSIVDTQMETLEDRKARFKVDKFKKQRAQANACIMLDEGLFDELHTLLDSPDSLIRQKVSVCLGRLLIAYDNDDGLKPIITKYLRISSDDDSANASGCKSIDVYRQRAALEAALCMIRPQLGVWALEQSGGVSQLLQLAIKGDTRSKEIAAELMCLASSTETGPSLLAPIIPSGAIEGLLNSTSHAVRAAAASTMTKISMKAKALKQDSPEIAHVINTAVTVLKNANKITVAKGDRALANASPLISFSSLDISASTATTTATVTAANAIKDTSGSSSSTIDIDCTSVERAIEVIAALISKTHIKEEVVSGSYRVAGAIEAILAIDIDLFSSNPTSSALYGISHILSSITVTNNELKTLALAEKGMTTEQYDKISELQRIKTEDKDGNIIGEEREDTDPDTMDLCTRRIQRICHLNAISVLAKILSKTQSSQAKEAAARALRQICVVETVRGLMVQQGALKACCSIASDKDNAKKTKLEAAHAIAKALVTTNPTMLSEHLRINVINPLLLLCNDIESSNLQQFEALLALTNIVSCGESEQKKMCNEKGVKDVHYLMFSDHHMVQRAACEVFCNMPLHEEVLKLLREAGKVRLWLGLCENYNHEAIDDDRKYEAHLAAKAASGTLAIAVADIEVCNALIVEDVSSTILHLLTSNSEDLLQRALVLIVEFITVATDKAVKHLVACGSNSQDNSKKIVPIVTAISMLKHQVLSPLASEACSCIAQYA